MNDSVSVDRTTLVDMITGNNLLTTDDSERRVLPVFLDAQMARPGERSFGFNPKERVRADRKRYLEAVVGLVQHWLGSGSKAAEPVRGFGGFEEWRYLTAAILASAEWRDLTAAILASAGVAGFGGETGRPSSARLYDDGTAAFVQLWWEGHGSKRVQSRQLKECSPPVEGESAQALASFVQRLARKVYEVHSGEGEVQVQVRLGGTDHRKTRYYHLTKVG